MAAVWWPHFLSWGSFFIDDSILCQHDKHTNKNKTNILLKKHSYNFFICTAKIERLWKPFHWCALTKKFRVHFIQRWVRPSHRLPDALPFPALQRITICIKQSTRHDSTPLEANKNEMRLNAVFFPVFPWKNWGDPDSGFRFVANIIFSSHSFCHLLHHNSL